LFTGHFLYLLGDEESGNTSVTISTRFVNATDYWKCLRFWYYIGDNRKPSSDGGLKSFHELGVYHINVNYSRSKNLWSSLDTTDDWTYVQLPLIEDENNFKVSSPEKVVFKDRF